MDIKIKQSRTILEPGDSFRACKLPLQTADAPLLNRHGEFFPNLLKHVFRKATGGNDHFFQILHAQQGSQIKHLGLTDVQGFNRQDHNFLEIEETAAMQIERPQAERPQRASGRVLTRT